MPKQWPHEKGGFAILYGASEDSVLRFSITTRHVLTCRHWDILENRAYINYNKIKERISDLR